MNEEEQNTIIALRVEANKLKCEMLELKLEYLREMYEKLYFEKETLNAENKHLRIQLAEKQPKRYVWSAWKWYKPQSNKEK